VLRHIDLDQLRLLEVSGADRIAFLQGQLTQDVTRAATDATRLAGWADAKGRLLWAGHLFARNEALCLLAPAASAEALVRRLSMFVLRAQVRVSVAGLAVTGLAADGPVALASLPGCALEPVRLSGDPARWLILGRPGEPLPAGLAAGSGTPNEWRLRDIRAGIPEVVPATSGEFVPQMVNLDLLDGISFTKGCYTGQEIVARTKYLGRVKRRMLRYALAGKPLDPGSALYGEDGPIGQVVSCAAAGPGVELLAVMRLDGMSRRVFADAGRSRPLEPLPLPYAVPELAS
jgi:folate-binding protein YgfZ